MELGNLIFGNSRGEYPIERGVGFENELERLFDAYAPEEEYVGAEFENETFSVFPYYWGDCTCGFNDIECPIKHINCYQNELEEEKLKNGWYRDSNGFLQYSGRGLKLGDNPLDVFDIEMKKEEEICKKLCDKYDLPFPDGCMVHCTCDYDKRYENWLKEIGYPEEHKDDCLLVKPNFYYKPTDFKIKWYKYPLRDSYSNRPITLKEFKHIIDDCIKSLKRVENKYHAP